MRSHNKVQYHGTEEEAQSLLHGAHNKSISGNSGWLDEFVEVDLGHEDHSDAFSAEFTADPNVARSSDSDEVLEFGRMSREQQPALMQEVDSDDELIPQADFDTNQGYFAGARRLLGRAANSVVTGGKYVIQHPIISISSVITAAPSALNALAGPSGKGPDQIGPEWWEGMSHWNRAFSILSGASSLVVNTVMGALFLPAAIKRFKESIVNMFKSPKDFVDNFFSLLLGLGGGLATAAIAYNSFLWLPAGMYVSIFPAVIAFSITFASRYLGIKNVFKRFANLFNKDAKLQEDLADKLDHLHMDQLFTLQEKLNEIIEDLQINPDLPLSEDDYNKVIGRLAGALSELSEMSPEKIFADATNAEYAKYYGGMIFDLVFSLAIVAAPSYLTYSQKGLDGVQIISKLSTGHEIQGLETVHKVLIGILPGLASAMYYGDAGINFRNTLVEVVKYLYENPKAIPGTVTLLVANGFAANSLWSIGNGVLSKENMYGLTNDEVGTTFKALFTTGGAVVNLNSTLNKAVLSGRELDAKDVTVPYLAKRLHKTSTTVISNDTATQIRQFSLWKESEQVRRRNVDTHGQDFNDLGMQSAVVLG